MSNEMTTTEGNKLIAEFDKGARMKKHVEGYAGTFLYIGNKHWIQSESLKYHTSWDWLMPVVVKIAKMKAFVYEDGTTDTFYPRTFGMLDKEGNFMVRINANTLFHDETLIGAVFKAVVDFIQWHTKNK